MIHICRTFLWISLGCWPLFSRVEALAAISPSALRTSSEVATSSDSPGGIGSIGPSNDPDPDQYVPLEAPLLDPDVIPSNGKRGLFPFPLPAGGSTGTIKVVGGTETVISSYDTPSSSTSFPSSSTAFPSSSSAAFPSSSTASPISLNVPTSWLNSTTSIPSQTGLTTIYTQPYTLSTSSSLPSSGNWTPSATIGPSQAALDNSNCSTLSPGEPYTVWSIVPNTTTITLTVTGEESTTYSPLPEFTPPVYCSETTESYAFVGHTPQPITPSNTNPSSVQSTLFGQAPTESNRATTTVIITAKNPPVVTSTAAFPSFLAGGESIKQTVAASETSDFGPPTFFGFASTITSIPSAQTTNEGSTLNGPVTAVLSGGVTVVVSPNSAVIGGQSYNIGSSTQIITQGSNVFTLGPSQVIGPMLVVDVPTSTSGGDVTGSPIQTTIQGVSVGLGPTGVVIGGTSYSVGSGAPDQTIVVKGQTISVGSAGVGFSGTTVLPPASSPSNFVVVGGEVFSAIGSSVAVIGDTTITYGAGIPATTEVVNGDSITIGPSGVSFDGTTLGGPAHATGTQLGIAGGLSVTEIGSTLAVVDGTTLTIGPGASSTTAVINGQTVTVDSSGLGIGGATLTFPFNPTTQVVTAGGVTFSEVGSSLVVIGGSTFTYGPGAKPTTDVFNGQTISIGPSGVAFKTTTFTAPSATHTGKKNSARGLRPVYGVLGTFMAIGIGYLL